MNKNLYNTAMNKVTMSDECLGEILDNLDDIPEESIKPKKVRYIHVLTAAIVFIFSTLTVAAAVGGTEWIKSFFKEEEIIPSVYDMVAEFEDFKCESNFNIKISPVGLLCGEQDFYAILHIDELPDNMKGEFINYCVESEIGKNLGGFGYSYSHDFDSEKDELILKLTCPQRVFKDGETVTLNLWYHEYNENSVIHEEILTLDNIAKLSFTLRLGEFDSLNINYREYMPDFIPECDYDFLFDEINITPFSIAAQGRLAFYADALINDPFKLILIDGTEVKCEDDGFSSYSGSDTLDEPSLYSNVYDKTAIFEKPIDPDCISEIYLGDMLIYRK